MANCRGAASAVDDRARAAAGPVVNSLTRRRAARSRCSLRRNIVSHVASDSVYALFATAIGECALAWSDVGLTGVWLPEARPGALRRKLAHRLAPVARDASRRPPSPPRSMRSRDCSPARASSSTTWRSTSPRSTPSAAASMRSREPSPPGRVLSYGEVARLVGGDATARAVGQALGANPFPIVVPCHRVVAAAGALGGFSAPGGVAAKRRLLAIEDARADGPPGPVRRAIGAGAESRG